jgi:His/Glu/Gln/Arg/opine family amino acid ABC transporter permease subunit
VATHRRAQKPQGERIPFYRNVKMLGVLAQLIFLAVIVLGVVTLYFNVTTALERSRIPANFGFLGSRAGIPIGESLIRYAPSDTYARALLVGVLNTLRVALVGVVLASLLGILVGVMRLSKNWLLRQIALVYIEVIRNTPLAVQLVFWYFAILIPFPPLISNPVELPLGAYFSQVGLALPWLYPSYSFSAWLPWLGGALLVFVALYGWRRRQLRRLERPGNAWTLPLLAAAVVAGVGFPLARGPLPEGVATDFLPQRGRGVVFIDADGDGVQDRGEAGLPYARLQISISEGVMVENTQNIVESRRRVQSTFRFPALREREFESAEVTFANPEAVTDLNIHYFNFPSSGLLYRDRNGSGEYDEGEERNLEDPNQGGFNGVPLYLRVEGFERSLTADRTGGFRIPQFSSEAQLSAAAAPDEETASETEGGDGGTTSPASLFGGGGAQSGSSQSPASLFGGASEETADEAPAPVDATLTVQPSGPLVPSFPSVPLTSYEGGVQLSAPFLALLLGLVIYTAAFIAEIVRGGIQAVNKGQREAAKSLGLSDNQTFQLIVFPQALRIILPPMISQYLNLTKNSSLALLITFVDFFAIGRIIGNQTGATVPIIVIIIGGYLLVSFVFAFILNVVNARFALVER